MQKMSISKSLFSILIITTDNSIGDVGATSLSDALKVNETLNELYLEREHKEWGETNTHISLYLLSTTGTSIGNTGAVSLSDALKKNTTLLKLYLSSKLK